MEKTIGFVGLDGHKDSISVAVAEDGRGGEGCYLGTVGAPALRKPVARLSGSQFQGLARGSRSVYVTKRCAIWCGRARRRCATCARRVSV